MERILWDAAHDGKPAEVREILKANPNIDVNWGDAEGRGALHAACMRGHDAIVKLLLAHPAVDVNLKTRSGDTPLMLTCSVGKPNCVLTLMTDPRVQPEEPNNFGYSPLRNAASGGHLAIIKWMIVSGRGFRVGRYLHPRNDAIGAAIESGNAATVFLLLEFKSNPSRTRFRLKIELGFKTELAAALFALVVFLCDGLLVLCPEYHTFKERRAVRFFAIAAQLPLELQMILCRRVHQSAKNRIASKTTEYAFRDLGLAFKTREDQRQPPA